MNLYYRLQELENKHEHDITPEEQKELNDLAREKERGFKNLENMSPKSQESYLEQWSPF